MARPESVYRLTPSLPISSPRVCLLDRPESVYRLTRACLLAHSVCLSAHPESAYWLAQSLSIGSPRVCLLARPESVYRLAHSLSIGSPRVCLLTPPESIGSPSVYQLAQSVYRLAKSLLACPESLYRLSQSLSIGSIVVFPISDSSLYVQLLKLYLFEHNIGLSFQFRWQMLLQAKV